MAMMTPDSKFPFGKHNGKSIKDVAAIDPSYLCWMRRTGFKDFGKEVTEAIFAWEEANPDEVRRIDHSIAKKRAAEDKADRLLETHAPLHDPQPIPVIAATANLEWGSW